MDMELNRVTLKKQRESRAWSQTQLAEVTGLSLRTVQRIEKTGVASPESAKALASVYECSIAELVEKSFSAPQGNKFALRHMSVKAKIIHLAVVLPVVSVALYLFLIDHQAVAWVDQLRDAVFSNTISAARLDKISFLILLVAVGLPALIPGYLYDFIHKQGAFDPLNG